MLMKNVAHDQGPGSAQGARIGDLERCGPTIADAAPGFMGVAVITLEG